MKKNLTPFKYSILIFLIIINVCIFFVGCNKDKLAEYRVYEEKNEFSVINYKPVGTAMGVTQIELDLNSNIVNLDYVSNLAIISKNDKYGLIDFNGNWIYGLEYDLIYFKHNAYVFLKGSFTIIRNFQNNKIVEFDSGLAEILYNNLIVFYTASSYKLDILTYDKDVLFTIYDKNRNFDNLTNYGKYMIYANVEFGEYQVYNLHGDVLYSVENLQSNMLNYIYNDRLLFISVSSSEISQNVYTNKIYNLITKEYENNYVEKIVYASNFGEGLYSLNEGYTFIATENERYFLTNSDFSNVINITNMVSYNNNILSNELFTINNYAYFINEEKGSLVILDKNFKEVDEILNIMNFYVNGKYMTIGLLNSNAEIEYKIYDTENFKIANSNTYNSLSMVVDNLAIASLVENDTTNYYLIDIEKNSKTLLSEASNYLSGLYYYYTENNGINSLIIKNFKQDTIFEKTNQKIYPHKNTDINISYDNQSYFLTTNDEKLYLNILQYSD